MMMMPYPYDGTKSDSAMGPEDCCENLFNIIYIEPSNSLCYKVALLRFLASCASLSSFLLPVTSTCAGNHWRKHTLSNSCNLNRREQISSVIHEPPFRIAWRAAFESQKKTRPLACNKTGVGTNRSERCHLHEDQAQDALNRPVVEKPPHRKKCTCTANYFIGHHPGTSNSSIRGPCVFSNHANHLAEGHFGPLCPLRVLPLMSTHRCLRLEWCCSQGNWTAAEWNQVVFRDESRFNLGRDNNCVRVGRPRGERLNPVFALERHNASTAGVMVWCAIAYNSVSQTVGRIENKRFKK
ncbi:transposable element Tcb1 transposase [Trichonephila clavipes]|nr:transposable element Tcb1 transposase [Trichonephila clavipes]